MSLFGLGLSRINQLCQQWFSHDGDTAWKTWVDLQRREFRDLKDLACDTRMGQQFRARALVVLFAPSRRLPVYWNWAGAWRDTMLGGSVMELEQLATELLDLVVELLIYAHTTLLKQPPGDDRTYALENCNQYAHQLLRLLPVEKADKVWGLFQINDLVAYASMDTASGYNPWYRLMSDPGIPMHWKQLADQRFREVIKQERSSPSQPRADWENALRCYINHLGTFFGIARYNGEFPYDVSLLVRQLNYILTLEEVAGQTVVDDYNLTTVLQLLGAKQYQRVRWMLVEHAVSDSTNRLRVYDAVSLQTAQAVLAQLEQAGNQEAIAQARAIIATGEEEVARRQQEAQASQDREETVLNQMRQV